MIRRGRVLTITDLPVRQSTPESLRGRLWVAVVGHGVASGSNLVMTVLAARELSVVHFGAFGIVLALNVVIAGVGRSLIGEPALVRGEGSAGAARDVYASGVSFGMLSGVLVAAAGAAFGGSTSAALIAFGVVLPGMVLQDLGRHLAFAALHPGRALFLDLIWAVLQVGGVLVLAMVADATVTGVVLVWGGSSWVAAIAALILSRCRLPRPSIRWIRASWSFSWRYLVGFAATAGVVQATTLALGSIVDVSAVGSVRGAQIIFGPLIPLYMGVSAVLVPAGARTSAGGERFRGQLMRISVLMTLAAGALTAVGLRVPDRVGQELLGDTWNSARDILLPAGLAAMAGGASAGALIGLRASRAVRATLSVQLLLVPVQMLLPIAGAIWWGTAGFMWATATATLFAACLWWRGWLRPLGTLR